MDCFNIFIPKSRDGILFNGWIVSTFSTTFLWNSAEQLGLLRWIRVSSPSPVWWTPWLECHPRWWASWRLPWRKSWKCLWRPDLVLGIFQGLEGWNHWSEADICIYIYISVYTHGIPLEWASPHFSQKTLGPLLFSPVGTMKVTATSSTSTIPQWSSPRWSIATWTGTLELRKWLKHEWFALLMVEHGKTILQSLLPLSPFLVIES